MIVILQWAGFNIYLSVSAAALLPDKKQVNKDSKRALEAKLGMAEYPM